MRSKKAILLFHILIPDGGARIYINFNSLLGTMSQLNYRENYQPPCPPRFK